MCLLFCQSLKDEPQVQDSGKQIYIVNEICSQVCGDVAHNLYEFEEQKVKVEADDDKAHDHRNHLILFTKAIDSCACKEGEED